jgi:putative RNA 2'-phosphotransferase
VNERERKRISKFLSLVLRHQPELIGLELDDSGWASVDALLAGCARQGRAIGREQLGEVVATNSKQRFAFSDDGRRIRASQGHSVEVELGYQASEPPTELFHGTVADALEAIRETGLEKMSRHHVHLSPDRQTATQVGGRRGRPIVLVVRARDMAAAGHGFYRSANGVWLTGYVPAGFIEFP